MNVIIMKNYKESDFYVFADKQIGYRVGSRNGGTFKEKFLHAFKKKLYKNSISKNHLVDSWYIPFPYTRTLAYKTVKRITKTYT